MPNKMSPHGGFVMPGSVSTGTVRTQDLLRAFASELERLVPFNSKSLVFEARDYADRLDDADARDQAQRYANLWNEAQGVVNDLCDSLAGIAKAHGLTFGSHPGDGADFGFWEVDRIDLAA